MLKNKKRTAIIVALAAIAVVVLAIVLRSCSNNEAEMTYKMTLNGAATINVAYGESYADEGVSFFDENGNPVSTEKQAELENELIVTGKESINTLIPGNYTITYTYKTQVLRREVIVGEKQTTEDQTGGQPGETHTGDDQTGDNDSNTSDDKTGNDDEDKDNTGDGTDSKPSEKPTDTTKPKYDMSKVSFKDANFVFEGQSHYIYISGQLPAGVTVSYVGNGQINAGTYTVVAKFSGDSKYQPIADISAKMTIVQAEYDMQSVLFVDKEFKYDGQAHSLYVDTSTLPKGVEVLNYVGNDKVEPGTYQVTVNFKSTNSNYRTPKSMTAQMTIVKTETKKLDYDMSKVQFKNDTTVYDGKSHRILITGTLPAGVTVSYVGNNQTNAGTYKITAVFKGDDKHNEIPSMTAYLVIKKANFNMSGVKLEPKTFTADGKKHSLQITGSLPKGVEIDHYENNNQTNVGSYKVKVYFKVTNPNYNVPDPLEATMTIKEKENTGGGDDNTGGGDDNTGGGDDNTGGGDDNTGGGDDNTGGDDGTDITGEEDDNTGGNTDFGEDTDGDSTGDEVTVGDGDDGTDITGGDDNTGGNTNFGEDTDGDTTGDTVTVGDDDGDGTDITDLDSDSSTNTNFGEGTDGDGNSDGVTVGDDDNATDIADDTTDITDNTTTIPDGTTDTNFGEDTEADGEDITETVTDLDETADGVTNIDVGFAENESEDEDGYESITVSDTDDATDLSTDDTDATDLDESEEASDEEEYADITEDAEPANTTFAEDALIESDSVETTATEFAESDDDDDAPAGEPADEEEGDGDANA